MRALLILASLLTACETTWQAHQGPNQAPELTATRRVFTFYMIKTVSVPATLTLDPKMIAKRSGDTSALVANAPNANGLQSILTTNGQKHLGPKKV
jgi:hypothetical protein